MLKSLLTEIIGIDEDTTHPADSLDAFKGTARVLVIFDDSTGELLRLQDEELTLEALRVMDITVAHVFGNSAVQVSKRPTHLAASAIREETSGPKIGTFGVVLIDRDGSIILRSVEPLSATDLAKAVGAASAA
jgi:hypothetical protein